MAAFTVIDHTEATGNITSWDVTSIPSSYDHLMIEVSARSDAVAYYTLMALTFNGDTGTNYSSTALYAGSTTPQSQRASGATSVSYQYITAASSAADTFSVNKIWIPHYSNAANFKQVLSSAAVEDDSTTDWQWLLFQNAGLWADTDAIDQVTLTNTNMIQYSTFTLYGITGA